MRLIVTCAVGLEDLLRGDLAHDGAQVTVGGDGELLVDGAEPDALRTNPMVDRVALPWAVGDDLSGAESLCRAGGFEGPIAFRVHERDASRLEVLLESVEAATGWTNDPSGWQVNLVPQAGRAEIGPLAWASRFGAMERLPATTPPAVAAGVLRLAKLRPGMRLLDPCGGVGTIPIVDALVRPGSGLVVDLSTESIELAQNNIRSFSLEDRVFAEVGDATDLDLADGCVDRVVSDVPFGKKIGSTKANDTLYPGLVAELARVLADDGRAILITDDKRRFADVVARNRSLKIVKETPLRYNGVTPTAFSISRVRARRR